MKTENEQAKVSNEEKPLLVVPIVIGCVYEQMIEGTIFKQKVLNNQGKFNNHDYYLVENIETGFIHTIRGEDLHCL